MIDQVDIMEDEKKSRMKSMRNLSKIIFLSCISRIAFMIYFFEPISFLISLMISLFGMISFLKRSKLCLSIYGFTCMFQAIGIYCFTIYYGLNNPQPLWMYAIYSFYIVLLSIGASSSFKLKHQIQSYENIYGDSSNNISNLRNDEEMGHLDTPNDNITMIQEPSQQSNNTVFMIPQNMIPTVYGQRSFTQQNNLISQPNNNSNNFHQPIISQNNFNQIPSSPNVSHIQAPFVFSQPQIPHIQQPIQHHQPNNFPFQSNQQFYRPHNHFSAQIISEQRFVPRQNVVYQI